MAVASGSCNDATLLGKHKLLVKPVVYKTLTSKSTCLSKLGLIMFTYDEISMKVALPWESISPRPS